MPEDGKEARKGPRQRMTSDQRDARAMSPSEGGAPDRTGKLKHHNFPFLKRKRSNVAKKKPEPEPEKDLCDLVESAIRDAISKVPGINDVPEADYCNAVVDACDAVKVGAEMRLEELGEEDE